MKLLTIILQIKQQIRSN